MQTPRRATRTNRTHNSCTLQPIINSQLSQRAESSRTSSTDSDIEDVDDTDDDMPLNISQRLRRRSIQGAERDKAEKKRRLVSAESPARKVSKTANSGAIQILPPLSAMSPAASPTRSPYRTPIPSSFQPHRSRSSAMSPTPTPFSASNASCVGQPSADANYVTSLCHRIREIANYVHEQDCEDYRLRTFIYDAMDALQDVGSQVHGNHGSSSQLAALQHGDETAFSTFEFALRRVVSRLQSMEVPMKDGKLALLLRGLRRELCGKN